MAVKKSIKKITLILAAMVVIPSTIYTISEIYSYNENEELLSKIYKEQLDGILFSVNQLAWDYVNSWTSKFDVIVANSGSVISKEDSLKQKTSLKNFLSSQSVFGQISFYDSSFSERWSVNSGNEVMNNILGDQKDYLKSNKDNLKRMIPLKSKNYRKIESFNFSADSSVSKFIGLVYLTEQNNENIYVILVMDSEYFINNILSKKLHELSGANLVCAVFNEDSKNSIISTQELAYNDALVRNKLWIFPNHTLGIGFSGFSLQEFTDSRMAKSIFLIIAVNLILILGVVFLYNNTRKEMKLAQLKSDFVSNVSHELRTPLSIIRMYAETLEMDRIPTKEKRLEYYKNISHEAERLTYLINNILNFSRIESGKKEYTFQKVALNDLIQKILETYSYLIEEKGFTLDLRLSKKELFIFADEGAITESIINLIDNALKYSTDKKNIIIITSLEPDSVKIAIQDSGMGILPENQERIFEKFYRESNSLIHNTKGSGLGLSIVKHNMIAHNGRVELKSIAGEGSVFTLCFPLNRSEDA